MTYQQIAEAVGMSRAAIVKFFQKRKAWLADAQATDEQVLQARLQRALGVPYTEIMQRTGLSYGRCLAATDGVQVVGRYVPRPAPPPPPTIGDEIRRLRQAGYTYKEIEAGLGVKRSKIRKHGAGVTAIRPPIVPVVN